MGTRRLGEIRYAMRQWRPEVKVATVVVMGRLLYVGSLVIPSYQAALSGQWVIFAGNLLIAGLATFAFILALWWALPWPTTRVDGGASSSATTDSSLSSVGDCP